MRSPWSPSLPLALSVAAITCAAGARAQPSAGPRWIWAAGSTGADDVCRFRRPLEFAAPVVKARLRMTCDNEFEASLGGEVVLRGNQWQRLHVADVTRALQAGPIELRVRAENHGGPAALIGRVDVELASGVSASIVTDATWEAARGDEPAPAWLPARDLGPADTRPWSDPFVERRATPAAKLQTRPGYGVELARSARDDEGSWISMAFGARGELYVGVERGGILRFEEPGRSEPEALDLPPAVRNAHGLAWAFDALWANVNGNQGGLHRLRDGDGDGRFEQVDEVVAWRGSGEHGAHAVVPGPDGWLWVVNGNMTDLPAGIAAESPHRLWAEDVLLPRFDDPGGHAVGVYAPGSHVLRIAPAGDRIELWAAGLRNAYDLAFDRHGELYTFDSDMEWDVGLPWYRPVRVCRVVSGAEFGWRAGSAKWPVESFDSLPGLFDVGRGSPTGVTMWESGRVAPQDRGALVAADWALGRILLVHVHAEPVRADTLVSGKPLNVTDVAVGPEGALWFVTGGRSTQSGLYRIAAHTGDVATAMPEPMAALDRFARRRALEVLHRAPREDGLDAAWSALGSADGDLRQVARVAVERVPVESWRARALAEADAARAMAALLALARAGGSRDVDSIVERLLAFTWRELPRQRQLEWLRVLAVAMARHGLPAAELRGRVLEALAPPAAGALPGGDFALDRERATVLVHLDADGLVPRLLDGIAATASQTEKIAFAALLARTRRGWTREHVEHFTDWVLGARARMGGGNSFAGYLDAMLGALEERLGGDPATVALAEGVRARRAAAEQPRDLATEPAAFVRSWRMPDLEPHLEAVAEGRSHVGGARALTIGQCFTCHRFGGKGGALGPDLTSVGSRLGRREILESILAPSQVISDQYELVTLTLRDGSTKVGRVQSATADDLTVVVDLVAGTTERVRAADVVARTPSPVSAMPAGLVDCLTLEQILDLIAYLETDGDADADAFK